MMKNVYSHPKHGAVRVKQGFCWPAFFFGSLWAAARRAYRLFFLLLLLDAVLWFATGYAAAQGSEAFALLGLLATLAYAVLRGLRGNEWVAASLMSRGYVLSRSVD